MQISAALLARGQLLATAESCTGGLIAAACTELAGSSLWFERGLVSYSNAAKTELLGVPAELIAQHGAVSEPVARAMAEGARARSGAQASLAVTGNAAMFEATLPWRVLDASGAEVRKGVAMTKEGNTFADYAFTVSLDPGLYTIEVTEEGADGEGWKPDVDTRTFTVR